MRQFPLYCGFFLPVLLAGAAVRADQVHLGAHNFTLPPGFIIEPAGAPPLADRPIEADFDERGRLYVSDSSGLTEKAEKQLQQKPHRIRRLVDSDGDGRFDRSTVFADKLMFPEGILWRDGSVYCAAPPSIWKFTDSDDDGVADERIEWFQGKTVTGCANDLHGPYQGPDGWIYWCKGAFAKQEHLRAGRPPFVTRASHIFRALPDATGLEAVLTGGMDNPVGVAFTPGGERLLSCTFLQHPGGGKRDGLIHAIYGGVYGKVHEVLDEHKQTGDLLPPMTHLGAAAPCGLARLASPSFGEEYRDNVFACLFNMHKVTRHALVEKGATFESRDSDFLVSDNVDFHPTDVLEDADGSLIVIDTGGWYKVCCPTSQLAKPDVLGAIYRVRRTGAAPVDDARGLRLDWEKASPGDLAGRLGDARPAVARRAVERLGGLGPAAVPALRQVLGASTSAEARRNAVWALCRMEGDDARRAARAALRDADPAVCQAAIHAASVRRDRGSLQDLLPILRGPSLQLRRAAAEAVGRMEDRSASAPLLAAAAGTDDRILEHSLIYALIEIADREGTAAGLQTADLRTRRAALIALDQMEGGGLGLDALLPHLTGADALLQDTAWWIAGRHPEWGGGLAGHFLQRLAAPQSAAGGADELERRLMRFARHPAIQEMALGLIRDAGKPRTARLIALRVLAQAGGKEIPAAWSEPIAGCLRESDAEVRRQAVACVRSLPAGKEPRAELSSAILSLGRNPQGEGAERLQALAALPGGLDEVGGEVFDFLVARLDARNPAVERTSAADVLARSRLGHEQLLSLAGRLEKLGPMETSRVIAAFEKSPDQDLGLKMVRSLKESAGLAGLRIDILKPLLAKYPAAVQQEGEALLAALNEDAGKQAARLEELLGSLLKGDIRRGQAIFNSAKAACSTCHAIGYLGGSIGPDLTTIGQIRTVRDLLESVVFPSASFVRSYEPVLVVTRSGQFHNGVVRKDGGDEMILATGLNTEARIPREDVAEIRPSAVSIMPQGLDQQLTPQELADLIAFLKGTQW